MANPRDTVEHEGIGAVYHTFKIDDSTITYSSTVANGSSQVGLAVRFSADRTIELVGDAEVVLGKLTSVTADKKGVVQTHGGMKLKGGTAATLTLGKQIVGDLLVAAEGYIREVAEGTAAELAVSRGMIVDNDATNPIVIL